MVQLFTEENAAQFDVPDAKNTLFDKWYEEKTNILFETDHIVVYVGKIVRVPGHILIVPKYSADKIADLDDEYLLALWRQVYVASEIVKKHLPCEGCYIAQNDELWKAQPNDPFHVKQVHVHVIPATDELDFSKRYALDEEDIERLRLQLKQGYS